MLKNIWHWFFHSWSTWTETYEIETYNGGFHTVQRRICSVCKKVEERFV